MGNNSKELLEILDYFTDHLGMKPRQKYVIILRIFHEMTFKEIGEIWGVGPATARNHYLNGLRFCRHPSRQAYLKGENLHYFQAIAWS